MKSLSVTIQIKAIEQYFVQGGSTFEFVEEILICDLSNESF